MRKIFTSVIAISSAIMAMVSCQVEIDDPATVSDSSHTVTIVSEISENPSTKVNVTEDDGKAVFSWSSNDYVSMFHVYENGVGATSVTKSLGSDGIMSLTATFDGKAEDKEYTYSGFFSKYNTIDEDVVYALLEGAQNMTNSDNKNSFDRQQMILVAEPLTTAESTIVFKYKRVVAVNKMTVKGLSSGEDIASVTISSEAKNLTGKYNYKAGEWITNGNTITVTVDPKTVTKDSEGNPIIYFTCAPVSGAMLSFTATTTAGKSYTKTLTKPVSFAEGSYNTFSVTVEDHSTPEPARFVKVTTEPEDWTGEYLLVYEPEEGTPLCWTGLDAGQCHVDATITDGVIAEIPNGAVTLVIEPMEGGYSIMINGGDNTRKYIGKSAYGNGMDIEADSQLNTLTVSDGSVVITGEGCDDYGSTVTLQYNKSSGTSNERFRYYKSGQEPVQLYKSTAPFVVKQPQTLSFPEAFYEVNLGDSFTSPTLSGAQTVVTYSSSYSDVASVDASTGAITIKAAGKTTITATAATDDTYMQGSASYTLTVIDPNAGALTTISEIFDASAENGTYKVTFDNWVVSAVKDNNVYVTDGTYGFMIYKSSHGFAVNDILSGTVTSCDLTRYNGSAEFKNITSTTSGLTVTKNGTVTTNETLSISELSGANTGTLITLSNLTYNGDVLTDGTNTITPYKTFYGGTFVTGQKYDVTGIYIQYNETKEIAPRDAADIVEVDTPTYGVSVAEGITNGTVTVSKADAMEYETITITATPDADYELDELTVVKPNGEPVSVSGNTFIMPASAVTVSATFKEGSDDGQGGAKTVHLDGSVLTTTATTEVTTETQDGITYVLSSGAKSQGSSSATNAFTEAPSILIGKSGAYIYNSTPLGKKITGFKIYANAGASAKVSVSVTFGTQMEPEGTAQYSATLSTLNSVYDCSDEIPANANYFVYKVTNANNSQVQFEITYED